MKTKSVARTSQRAFDGLLDRVAFYIPYKAAFDAAACDPPLQRVQRMIGTWWSVASGQG